MGSLIFGYEKIVVMKYKIFVNNLWQENTIILFDETGKAAIIDCGCFTKEEEQKVQKFLLEQKLTPVVLLNTHLHPDHIFGNRFIKETYGLSAKASADDAFLIENAVEFAAMLGLRGVNPPPPVGEYLTGADRVRFGHSELQVISVRGHSPGGLCFYSEEARLLLSGDVLFAGSIGRSDLPGGDGEILVKDIRQKLFTLPDDVIVIPGHGPLTTIGEEKKYNPFLNEF